jgi:histidinol-phosphatase (PHP family)
MDAKLYDQHLHSWNSVDARDDPVDCAREAIARGLGGITFTEHYDPHPEDWPICIYDYERIARTVEGLRETFGEQLFIGHGIEVCYQPGQMDQILAHIERHRFDLVLLSVHWFHGRALHHRHHWEGCDAASATRAYLETVLEAVRFVRDLARRGQRPFDVLGHLDLVKRYTQRYFQVFDVLSYRPIVEEILAACVEADLPIELNLSTLRQSLPEPMPGDWVVRRYVELGGEVMTLGSDAHRAADVGAGFDAAVTLLRDAGVKYQVVFRERQRCLSTW